MASTIPNDADPRQDIGAETRQDAGAGNNQSPARVIRRGKYRYPPGLRLNLPFYLGAKFFKPGNPILLFEHLAQYGRAAHYRLLWHHIVLLNDPSDIREVLVDKARFFIKERTQQRMKIVIGEGLITSDGEAHKRQRRMAAPAFHRKRIAAYAAQIVELADSFADTWREGEPFDISAAMMQLALSITARTFFDTEVTSEVQQISDEVNTVMDLYNYLVALPRAELMLDWPLPKMRRFRKAKARLDAVVDGMIAAKQQAVRAATERGEPVAGDLLSMLIAARDEEADTESEAGRGMTADQLRDQVLTIFLAGFETVANALAWTWLLLGENPEAEARLRLELDTALGSRLPTLEDLPRLPFTEMVVAESLRLYPPAWAMGRQAIADVEIGPYRLPKGSFVFFSQYIVQRNALYFPDPTAFRPERFTAEAKAARPRFAYFPFGGGGRQCIGESFAWMEAILTLATLAQRWRLQLVPGQTIAMQPKITLRPAPPGIWVTPVRG